MLNSWNFEIKNTLELEKELSNEDLKNFGFRHLLRWTEENTKKYMIKSNRYITENIFKLKSNVAWSVKLYKL